MIRAALTSTDEGAPLKAGTLVLMYHRINMLKPDPWTTCVSPAHFEEHLQVIRSLPVRVLVTLDDGYADNYEHAKPRLEKYDTRAIVFVTSGAVGSPYEMWWDELERTYLGENARDWQWDDADADEGAALYRQAFHEARLRGFAQAADRLPARADRRMMTREEVRELAAGGLIEIGAHTVTHPVLSQLDHERQRWEIYQSKHDLEETTGQRVSAFAYPNGFPVDYSSETVRLVRDAGFRCAYAAWDAPFGVNWDDFEIPRVMVRNWDGDRFARLLWGKITL